jgi:hypothetical protein
LFNGDVFHDVGVVVIFPLSSFGSIVSRRAATVLFIW